MEKIKYKISLRAHTIIGIFCIFLFYYSYFGSLTFFLPYISCGNFFSKHIEKSINYSF